MFLTRRLTLAVLAAVLVACAAPAFAVDEPGAGPIVVRSNPCFIANHARSGPRCPEPEVATNGSSAERAANRLARARYFIDMQDIAAARREAELAVSIDESDRTARLLSARLAITGGDVARAERDLGILRARIADDADVNATYATLLLSKNAGDEALREFHGIVARHPGHLYAREQRARLLMMARRYDAALADLNVLVDADPAGTNARVLRSEALLALKRPLPATADLTAALEARPDQFFLLVARASAYAEAELDERALADYDKLLDLSGGFPLYAMPDNERARLLVKRAFVLSHLKRYERAADDVVTAIRMGGVQATLRAQVLLRRHGFSEVPMDGKDSPALRQAVSACFGLNACFQGMMQAI